jgi:hypothetical protein
MGDRTEEEKWREYPCTVLEFYGPPPGRVDLRRPLGDAERAFLATIGVEAPFAVLTAENPGGENAEDAPTEGAERAREARNERRVSALERELESSGIPFALVDGAAPDGDYRERCVAVALPRAAATALAERLRQLALFWYDGRDFWLLPAEADQEPERLPRTGG